MIAAKTGHFWPYGYIYDTDTGLYYLQSRYYDPELGRFINADAFTSTGQGILGNNMFAYCNNNPLCYSDRSGYRRVDVISEINDGSLTYILDQESESIGNQRFGCTSVSHGGCGVVASYNALISLGRAYGFSEVLAYYNSRMHETIGGGLVGLLPYNIERFFTSLGYTVVTTNINSQIEVLSQDADTCILYYEYYHTYYPFEYLPIEAYGAHFIQYNVQGAGYIGRNTTESNGLFQFNSPSGYGNLNQRYYCVGIFIFK